MRKLVVVLVGVAVVASGLPLRAQDLHTHRHYILRALATDIDAVASRHSLLIERSDEGPPSIFVAASNQDPTVLTTEMAQDPAVLAFEEEQVLSLPETGLPSLPTAPETSAAPAPDPGSTVTPVVETAPVVVLPSTEPAPAPSAASAPDPA